MRKLIAMLTGLLAALLLIIAIPTSWVDQKIMDTDGFVSFVAPLSTSDEFAVAMANTFSSPITDSLGLPTQMNSFVHRSLTRAFQGLFDVEGFDFAWQETLRRTHQEMFTGQRQAVFDYTPLAALAVTPLNEDWAAEINQGRLVADLGNDKADYLLSQSRHIRTALFIFAGGGFVLAVIALVMSKHKARALMLMSLLFVGGSFALRWLITDHLPSGIQALAADNDSAHTIASFVATNVTNSISDWMFGAAIIGIAIGVLAGFFAFVKRS